MELIDYTGKLNNHNEYLQTINQLENKCKYIEYVLVNEDETKFYCFRVGVIIKSFI